MWTQNIILRKQHHFEINLPTLQQNLPLPASSPPPLKAAHTKSSPELHEFVIQEPIKPISEYTSVPKACGCREAIQLLSTFPHAQHPYEDGFFTPPFQNLTGSAFPMPLQTETLVRTAPCPKPGCAAAEFQSCILALQYVSNFSKKSIQNTIIIFCDNESVVNKINFLKQKKSPPVPSDGIYGDMLFQIWSLLQSCPATTFIARIKAHANIHGKELAEWATGTPLPEFQRMPPTFPVFYFLQQALVSKLSPSQYSNLIAHPAHTGFIPPTSFMWHQKTPLTFLTPFKWSNAVYSIRGYAAFYDKQPRMCPFCHSFHPLDPFSYITYCPCPFPSSLTTEVISAWPLQLVPQIKDGGCLRVGTNPRGMSLHEEANRWGFVNSRPPQWLHPGPPLQHEASYL